jgi:hypothetical protein
MSGGSRTWASGATTGDTAKVLRQSMQYNMNKIDQETNLDFYTYHLTCCGVGSDEGMCRGRCCRTRWWRVAGGSRVKTQRISQIRNQQNHITCQIDAGILSSFNRSLGLDSNSHLSDPLSGTWNRFLRLQQMSERE